MIRFKDTSIQSPQALLRNAIGIAEYYGFVPLDDIPRARDIIKSDTKSQKTIGKDIMFARRDERALCSAVRHCLSRQCTPKDIVLAWRIVQNATVSVSSASRSPSTTLELHILGTQNTIAEVLLIIVGSAIVRESGVNTHVVLINNIGSHESSGRFIRDIGLYLRKHIESISPTLRSRAATDPLGTLVQLIERGHPMTSRAPQATEYLNEDERRRFWELLEYLEAFGLSYELNAHILGSRDCWSHALYEISQVDSATGLRVPIAFGGRYDPLVSRFARAPRTGAMISIVFEHIDDRGVRSNLPPQPTSIVPVIYFAHLGNAAKQRALSILESLRQAGIRVHQNLWHDHLGEQMAHAALIGASYVLILGHKEATEGTIIVREIATNSQSAIPIEDLVKYLKRHRVMSRDAR
jgi:histidyl-tRNA synthetase